MFKKSYSKKISEKLAEGMKTAYEQRIRQLEERVDRLNVENKNLRAACAEYQSREKRWDRPSWTPRKRVRKLRNCTA